MHWEFEYSVSYPWKNRVLVSYMKNAYIPKKLKQCFKKLTSLSKNDPLSQKQKPLGKVHYLWDGGPHLPQIVISLANDFIQANDFIRVPLSKIPKNSKSKNVRPPIWRVQKMLPPQVPPPHLINNEPSLNTFNFFFDFQWINIIYMYVNYKVVKN